MVEKAILGPTSFPHHAVRDIFRENKEGKNGGTNWLSLHKLFLQVQQIWKEGVGIQVIKEESSFPSFAA